MKKRFTLLLVIVALSFTAAQNDIKARIEFEEAEKAFTEKKFEEALLHLDETEKQLNKWTPLVSYLKIETLYAITDMGSFNAPSMQPLYDEVSQYMTYLNKLKSDDIPMDKYKVVYGIEKSLNVLKLNERQSREFINAKKEMDAQNYNTAIPLLEKLISKGNSWAMRNLGLIYELTREKDKAIDWYMKAIDKGNTQAACDLAKLYIDLKDDTNTRIWYEKAASMGHPKGVFFQGYYIQKKDENPQQALVYFQKASDLGDADGSIAAAHLFREGLGTEKNYNKAYEYYLKAANKGNSYGLSGIGMLYHNGGNDIQHSYTIAMEWYLKAAEQKNTQAMHQIAWIYRNGQGEFTKDYSKAEQWNLKAVENNNASSYIYLGELNSLSDNNHPQKALEYYEKAAEAGFLAGFLQTAHLYFLGKDGISKDYKKAVKYYEEYYENQKKNESYLDNLIEIYNRGGYGIEKDKEKAKYWKNIRRR